MRTQIVRISCDDISDYAGLNSALAKTGYRMMSTETKSSRIELLPLGVAMGCATAAVIGVHDAIDWWLLRVVVSGLIAGITAYVAYRAASTAARMLRSSQ